MIDIYIDGASSGNPGKMGIGYILYRNGEVLKKESIPLGVGTNNFAEYMACIFALTDLILMGEDACRLFSDSKLLCEQIRGSYRVKSKNIYPLFMLIKRIVSGLKHFEINHILRENNREADRLAKEATGFLVS